MTFPENYFRRMDESDDDIFYEMPRLVVHIDDAAIAATTDLYRRYLPSDGDILDLMSSWRSHLPEEVAYRSVVGLGLNAVEMHENPQLTDAVVHNLNKNPQLPFPDEAFDACVLTVSVQYLIHPIDVFTEVGRVLRPEAPFITVFSNRMFPTKAVAIWQSLDAEGHMQLVETYYRGAACFDEIEIIDCSHAKGDPLYAVVGRRMTSL
ncbi:MAG: methyltransferase domain-containing protein [Chloroflexi bacterium AL-W]|nr:methyltransferase domain-containing protein [Chloroflexi bacterium AL-N1]NOK71222.1 methyltransferase domain-containing protein [Chloroflexi bacterium AL-N10]NOK76511.1 methyltransferase domain-containing protein [Chloroflexi bacterium AL-N5]NOK83628.1 methyltransferase domain-containing protein [Chloroflexi bacterium AL-W]NOK92250.1 methyltransferase domain-containing protein [Chloroflexi bacterium AL-N15]